MVAHDFYNDDCKYLVLGNFKNMYNLTDSFMMQYIFWSFIFDICTLTESLS